jgi:hypothetical protein
MEISEMKVKLEGAGVPSNVYIICERGIKDQKMCLFKQEEKWVVYYCERGLEFDYVEFSSEEDACEEFYNRLV